MQPPEIYSLLYGKKCVSMVAKLRTSSHNLRIEMGRRTGTIRELRLCYCGNDIENENHFLLECNLYYEIRRKYNIRNTSVSEVLNNEKLVKYIYELFEKRKEYV